MPAQAVLDGGKEGAAGRELGANAGGLSCVLVQLEGRAADLHRFPVGAPGGVGLGERGEGDVGRPALARVDGVEEALDDAFDRGRQLVAERELEVIPGLVVLACGVVRAGQLQADPGQVRADDEDGFVLLGRLARQTETHVDRAQQEVPFDRLLFVGGPGLLQERECVLEAPGRHEQPAGREIGDFGPGGRLARGLSGFRVRPDGDQGRQGTRGNETGDRSRKHTPGAPRRGA